MNLRRVSTGTIAFWTSTVLAVATLGALVAITIRLGSVDARTGTQIYALLMAAAALTILCITGIFATIVLFLLRTTRKLQVVCCAGFAPLAIIAAALTIYSLARIWNIKREFSSSDEGAENAVVIAEAGFAVWAISAIAQISLYTIVLWPDRPADGSLTASELTARLQSYQARKRSISVRMRSFSSPRESPCVDRAGANAIASHFSSPSISPRPSFRRSVSLAIRPMTSKTRLLFRSSMISRDSRSLYSARDASMDGIRTENEFRSWDTAGVEEEHSDPFIARSTRRTRLDTIPGSRPASPAKRLDGPFGKVPAADMPLPESPTASPVLSHSASGSVRTRTRALSRPHSSCSQHEAHIHPLFRSESPNPPPLASPGTVITASPLAGQVVNSEQQYFSPPRRLYSTHGSRPASPSPLSPASPARSRQGSFKSPTMQHSSPTELRSPMALSWGAGQEG